MSSPEFNPTTFDPTTYRWSFRDLNGFKDFIGSVTLCSPDYFPKRDWLEDHEQMNLDRAFIGLHYGLELCAKEIRSAEIRQKCHELFDEAYEHYKHRRVLEGEKKMKEVDKLLRRYRTP